MKKWLLGSLAILVGAVILLLAARRAGSADGLGHIPQIEDAPAFHAFLVQRLSGTSQ